MLYLPQCWAQDAERRTQAHVPEGVTFKTKHALALDMIERGVKAGIPGEFVLADAAYGDSSEFRNGVHNLGFDFAVGVQSTLRVLRLDSRDPIDEPALSASTCQEKRELGQFCPVLVWRAEPGLGAPPLVGLASVPR